MAIVEQSFMLMVNILMRFKTALLKKPEINKYSNNIKLPKYGKESLCFHNDGIILHTVQCAKSISKSIFVEDILSIGSFDQRHVVLDIILQLKQLKNHMVVIGVYSQFSFSTIYKHNFM